MNVQNTAYHPPVDQLLTLGETDPVPHGRWPDYLALGIGPQDIPELLRMANDESLNQIGKVEGPEDWASIHAVRALGQLRDESTVEQLVELLTTQHDHEWIQEELPEVFGLIGPAAIPALAAYLADSSHPMYPRSYAADGLAAIAKNFPERRDECISPLVQELKKYAENAPEFNAFLIGNLSELKATETLPLIEEAFKAGSVDEFIITLEDVQVFMGLKERERQPVLLDDLLSTMSTQAAAPPPNPPRRIAGMSTPAKFSGKKIGGKKKHHGKKK
jgi:HEAT repeat protein